MFDIKVGYLEDENFNLRRQLHSLKQILSAESESNKRSLIFQIEEQNHQLTEELQSCKDAVFVVLSSCCLRKKPGR